jgi:LCP family protein required for cell wall assembly
VQEAAQEKLAAPAPGLPGQPRVALVIGEDQRPGEATWRSDTMMLVRLDPETKTMTVLSFPRDLVVDIPGHGRQPINQAFALGKEDLALQTVQALTGIQPNYLVPVNFKGFEEIVNVFGPVWVEIDRRYYNKNLGTEATNFDAIDLHPGYQPLNGRRALDFSRYRHSDSDIVRVGRQQAFMREFKKRLDVWTAARDLFKLIGVAKDNIKILGAKGAAPDTDTFLEYGQLMSEIGGNVTSVQLNTTAYSGNVNWVYASPDEMRRAVNAFLHPDTTLANRVLVSEGLKDPNKTAPKPAFRKATARIEIRNGASSTDSLAGDVEYLLAERGWKRVFADGNADRFDYLHTTIYTDKTKGGKAIGAALEKEFPAARIKPLDKAVRDKLALGGAIDAGVVVVVGRDWNGELSPAIQAQLPERERGELTAPDPKRDLEQWQAMQQKARFPLMMPTRLEVNMQANDPTSGYEPFRAYKAGPYPAAHVTYTGYDQYQGIFTFQAVRWRNPPIIEGFNEERKIGGRDCKLFFNGAKIHRILWQEGGATYWISNSFTDYYPNSVMIEIAKSFVPVPKK